MVSCVVSLQLNPDVCNRAPRQRGELSEYDGELCGVLQEAYSEKDVYMDWFIS